MGKIVLNIYICVKKYKINKIEGLTKSEKIKKN